MSSPVSAFHVSYRYVEGMIQERGPYREDHLRVANQWMEEGKLLFIGAFSDHCNGAILIFDAEKVSMGNVLEYVQKDPYVKANLVTEYIIRPMKGFTSQ